MSGKDVGNTLVLSSCQACLLLFAVWGDLRVGCVGGEEKRSWRSGRGIGLGMGDGVMGGDERD